MRRPETKLLFRSGISTDLGGSSLMRRAKCREARAGPADAIGDIVQSISKSPARRGTMRSLIPS